MFSEQFAFDLPAIVNFVGGGGKTPLILKLMDEYSHASHVIYCTTTRIHPPESADGLAIIACDNPEILRVLVEKSARCCDHVRRLVVTRNTIAPRLLGWVAPDFGQTLDPALFPIILNEADGARSMSLKMPRAGEPVLMEGASYLIPVIGMDCLMKPLGPETLFRWETASKQFSLKEGQLLTPELAAGLLLHPQGVCKDWRRGMRLIPFLNKADGEADDPLAKALAGALLQNGIFPVERVVWGSVYRCRADSISAPGR